MNLFNMKKIVAIISVLVLIFAFCACFDNWNVDVDGPESTTPVVQATPTPTGVNLEEDVFGGGDSVVTTPENGSEPDATAGQTATVTQAPQSTDAVNNTATATQAPQITATPDNGNAATDAPTVTATPTAKPSTPKPTTGIVQLPMDKF